MTFRLHDSLPTGRYFHPGSQDSGKVFAAIDRLLDGGSSGPRYLRIPAIAQLVASAIQRGGQQDYSLHSWVVMPNHVHLLITPSSDISVLLQQLKGRTGREANAQLHREEQPFWQSESFDRLVRDDREFRRIDNYIVRNPARAGLVANPDEYPWSSATNPPAG